MQVIAADITGPFPESDNGNCYILVVGDYFTKFMEAYAIPDQEARTVATKLVDELFCRFSVPEQLHTDQGKQFESHLIEEICGILKISKTRTTAYHPQCDGLVERFNRTLKHMLSTTLKDHPFDWEQRLKKVCMAYNSSIHASTGYSPHYLLFGSEARLPLDLMYDTGKHHQQPVQKYAADLRQHLQDAHRVVRQQLQHTHVRQKEYYDRKVHGDPHKEGDLVWLHNPAIPPGESAKLHHPWTGPYKILKKISDADYRIKELFGKKSPLIVHFDRLKSCHPGTRFAEPPDSPDEQGQGSERPPLHHHYELQPDDLIPVLRRSTRTRQQPVRFREMLGTSSVT